MARFFANPRIFSAFAIASDEDPMTSDVALGTHIRLLPSPLIGFPLSPFGIWRVTVQSDDQRVTAWIDREQRPASPDLDAAGGELTALVGAPPGPEELRDVAVEIEPAGSAKMSAGLRRVDQRRIAQRSAAPWLLGAPSLRRIDLWGTAPALHLKVFSVSAGQAVELMLVRNPDYMLSLPLDEPLAWYAGGEGPDRAQERVERGAPQRLTPLDRPDGSFDRIPTADEVSRIEAQAQGLDANLRGLLGDPGTPPWEQSYGDYRDADLAAHKPWQSVDIALQNTLLMQAMDPGIARYFGLMANLDEGPEWPPSAWTAAAVFAIDPDRVLASGERLKDIVGEPNPFEERIIQNFRRFVPGLNEVADKRLDAGYSLRLFATAVAAVPPPDRPEMPKPRLAGSRWLRSADGPSTAFRQDFTFNWVPLGVGASMARLEANGWAHRQETITLDPSATVQIRAVPLLLGRDSSGSRLATDAPLEARTESWQYRFYLSDLFGRYGEPSEVDVPTPERPAPPTPVVAIELIPAEPDQDSPGSLAAGTGIMRVAVPRVEDLAAGSLEIALLRTSVGQDLPVSPGTTAQLEFSLPELAPSKTGSVSLTAKFVDSAGRESISWNETITVTDRRRPQRLPVGRGIIWTSRPGPGPEVELKLTWPGREGECYRAYLADARSLGIQGNSRAEIARAGGDANLDETTRPAFRLLTDPPLGGSEGPIILDERLPRSLQTVQFVRIVPLTGAGVEADFGSCGVVPAAVPTDRAPPPPRLTTQILPGASTASLTIEAVGLDLVELRATEPGLFDEPSSGSPPEFRLRRASGPINDPVYAREICRGFLRLRTDGEAILFHADVPDPANGGLVPYVRYTYWAEVRMPPERRLAGGIGEIPPGAVTALEAAQTADCPRPFSGLSAPASAMLVPAEVPALAADSVAVSIEGSPGLVWIKLAVESTPATHPLAIGPFRLRIWEQWDEENMVMVPDINLDGGPLEWTSTPPRPAAGAPAKATLRLALVDPLGREGPILTKSST